MPALIQFVDSISASPTVRLDINDSAAWFCTNFSAPLPRLRRSESGNSMRDGGVVGSATYENRTLEIELTLVNTSTEDAAATEMQKLWRELDRPTNYLRYQREGMTKPVFFRLFRSDAADFEELWTTPIARNITLEILAEPFARGLKETLGPYTVSNNPAAGSNPCYVDLPTILGDVATDVVYWDDALGGTTYMQRCIAVHSGSNATSVTTVIQAESMTNGQDTTNPGGAADSAMSGAGTTNYLRTTFATDTTLVVTRLSSALTVVQPGGRYRVYVAVRRAAATSTLRIRADLGQSGAAAVRWQSDTVTIPAVAGRHLLDLGVTTWPDGTPVGSSAVPSASTAGILLYASRTSGTDNLDWDAVILVPAGDQYGSTGGGMALAQAPSGGLVNLQRLVLDGANDASFVTSSTSDPTTTALSRITANLTGGFPRITPGVANRLHVLSWSSVAAAVASTTTVNLAYWPLYLAVRPVST